MIITKECKGLQTNTVVLEFSCTLGGFCRDKHNIGFYSETQKLYDREIWNCAYGKQQFVPLDYVFFFTCPLLLITSTQILVVSCQFYQ